MKGFSIKKIAAVAVGAALLVTVHAPAKDADTIINAVIKIK